MTADEIPNPQQLGIACRVNGTTMQDSSTAEMIFGVAELVSVGFARTPPVYLGHGDVVEVEIVVV